MGSKNGHFREFGKFRLDAEKKVLWAEDKPVNLQLKEIELLCLFTERRGEVLTKDEILDHVWADSFVEESNLSQHIYRLRKTFKEFGESQELIRTVPRRGYSFVGKIGQNGSGDLVIERHSISKTVIEELDDSDEPNVKTITAVDTATKPRSRYLLPIAAAMIVAVAAGIFFYTRSVTAQPIKSIAVLPFKTLNAPTENTHSGVGLADVLITRLGNLKQINVRPTSAVYELENTEIDAAEAAQKLAVDAIVDGTIYYVGDNVKVTARMMRVSDQKVLWTDDFEQPAADEMKIQNEIVLNVAYALTNDLSQSEKDALAKLPTTNDEAYQLYLKGRFNWNKRNADGLLDAERYFRAAIEKDPDFALAYVGLADSMLFGYDGTGAANAVEKALSIDPNLGEAYATLGFHKMFHRWRWDDAEENFKRAIELKPGYGTAHQWYATLLMIRGRHKEAVAELARALEINPNSYNYLADLGQAYYFARDYNSASMYNQQATTIYPGFVFAHENFSALSIQMELYETVVNYMIEAEVLRNGDPRYYSANRERIKKFFQKLTDAAKTGEARKFWKTYLEYFDIGEDANPNVPFLKAWVLGKIGEKEKALDALENAVDRKAFMAPFANVDPRFDEIRNEPRFAAIMRKMNL